MRGTTQGMWPYSYSKCDVGTLANQTNADKTAPYAALHAHGLYSNSVGNKLSFLEGQRASACTCPGEDHPGPSNNVGRSSPEIDIFETQVLNGHGHASQSFQIAPFDAIIRGIKHRASQRCIRPIPSSTRTRVGSIKRQFRRSLPSRYRVRPFGRYTGHDGGTMGSRLDQRRFGIDHLVSQRSTELDAHRCRIGTECRNGDRAENDTDRANEYRDQPSVERWVPEVKWNQIAFPAVMKLDYVRVYQRDGQEDRITCDPDDHPTAKYMRSIWMCIAILTILFFRRRSIRKFPLPPLTVQWKGSDERGC